ncbi:ABC transporter ATP-binding protein [Brucella pseudogrignonensis]|jgi:branched-chain amino acid transport system ATP-binding protein|uniref:ABC transporter ATP-binding protein n=1 Tax=Brucella pseudogrignonensis TaxID=419475 RepID=A0A7Y3T8M7_9HYPH|nr:MULTISPECIES: ABC transporter ATP-binding protein [Brucella]MCD4513571.1 ABC transporter ATP-binding protein [Brucella pseudogrignonensis]MCM0753461.1 ABC transporter ATP-binding protein [Brucella pseudogrignonensis]NNV23002.1 ABC transporter ATP-binding protein [Brucella pseudogrignonensis]
MTDVLLELRNVTVSYSGDITILKDLTIKAQTGKITGIIGPNGAGKSTALKTMYRMLNVGSGELLYKDDVISRIDQTELIRRGIAFVPQNHSIFGGLSVRDNLVLGGWSIRREQARIRDAIERVYDIFPMLREKDRALAGTLSGGQQRFLEIARSLITDPEVILFDEPSAMIAPKYSKQIYQFLTRMKDSGKTVILVDQNVRQCVNVSDHLYVLELGRNKIDCETAEMSGNTEMMDLIAGWIAHKVD